MGAQNFNFELTLSAPNSVFLKENFRTRTIFSDKLKFSGGGANVPIPRHNCRNHKQATPNGHKKPMSKISDAVKRYRRYLVLSIGLAAVAVAAAM